MLCGIGGVGKTTLTKEFIAEMKKKGERVEIISRCHVSAKPLGGHTADKYTLSTLGGFRNGTLVIEEASQVPHYIWCQLLGLKTVGDQIFDSGRYRQPIAIGFRLFSRSRVGAKSKC